MPPVAIREVFFVRQGWGGRERMGEDERGWERTQEDGL